MAQHDLEFDVPARTTHVRYRVLAAACALAFVTYVERLGFGIGIPEIKESLHLSPRHRIGCVGFFANDGCGVRWQAAKIEHIGCPRVANPRFYGRLEMQGA